MKTFELQELEDRTIACKLMTIENENTVGISRIYIGYTEDQIELAKIKQLVGVQAYYEIISIWNNA